MLIKGLLGPRQLSLALMELIVIVEKINNNKKKYMNTHYNRGNDLGVVIAGGHEASCLDKVAREGLSEVRPKDQKHAAGPGFDAEIRNGP